MSQPSDEQLAVLAAWAQEQMRREVIEPTARQVEAQRQRCRERLARLQLGSDDLLVREDAEMLALYLDGQLLRLDRIMANVERELSELPARVRAYAETRRHA